MSISKFLDGHVFDPDTVQTMSEALAGASRSLGLADRDDAVTRLVAMRIIELARNGERDAERLTAAALEILLQ